MKGRIVDDMLDKEVTDSDCSGSSVDSGSSSASVSDTRSSPASGSSLDLDSGTRSNDVSDTSSDSVNGTGSNDISGSSLDSVSSAWNLLCGGDHGR